MTIFNNKIDFMFIKFPIIFPIIYVLILYSFPSLENYIIYFVILLLAEPHFAATWPFFLNKINKNYIKHERIALIFIPITILFFCLMGFFFFKELFLLIFFLANIFHVTRQSIGIYKLFGGYDLSVINTIYIFNSLFFFIGFFRFYYPLIDFKNLVLLNLTVIILFILSTIILFLKKKLKNNFFTFLTGIIIFYPICFVSNPIHSILLGVTMHYSQYLLLTYKVEMKRKIFNNDINDSNFKLFDYFKTNINFLFIIFIYAIVMFFFSTFSNETTFLKNLLIIPITAQMLHFYIDSQLWKFSVDHNKNSVLKFLKN